MTALLPLHAFGLLLWAAQSAPASPSEKSDASDPGARFFQMTIDFWKSGPRTAGPRRPESAIEPLRESIWAEPVRQPDGRFSIYVPPKAVLDFLENPTPESLKGYLDWKRARAEKLRRALELLAEHQAQQEAPSPPPAPPGVAPAPSVRSETQDSAPKVTLTYFHGKGCPHCATQDGTLARWLAAHPEASVRVLELGESPELWLKYRVRGTPSLLLRLPSMDAEVLLEGISDEARLDQALGSIRNPASIPK
jgi:hypothetical protein